MYGQVRACHIVVTFIWGPISMQGVAYSENLRKSVNRFWLFSVNVTVNRSPGGVAKRRERRGLVICELRNGELVKCELGL